MKKNILFILTDQWRADSLGYSGNKIVKTPNLDKLAEKSHVFTNSHTVTPLCSPARGCLMTGLYPYENGVRDNLYVGGSTQTPLDQKNDTWLARAAENGYHTGYFGKWHLGQWHAEQKNIEFDTLRDKFEFNLMHKKSNTMATERGELKKGINNENLNPERAEDWVPYYGLREDKTTAVDYKSCEKAIEFLNKADDTPWCLTVSLVQPHFPLVVPEPFYSMYNYKDMPLPDSLNDRFLNKPWFQNRHWWSTMNTDCLTDDDWRKTIAAYYGLISFTDSLIGKVIEAAKANSGDRETICIFTADHGEMLGSHSRFDKGAYFYEEVMRTPLLVCSDLNNSEHSIQTEYCQTQDIAKTLYRAVNAKGTKGRDLISLINGSSDDEWKDEAFGVYHKYNGHSFEVRTITTPRYKFSFVPQDIDELYDLEKDPNELCNVSDDDNYLEIKEKLKERLLSHMKKNDDYLINIIDKLPAAGTVCDV